jgi:hypothetical protein
MAPKDYPPDRRMPAEVPLFERVIAALIVPAILGWVALGGAMWIRGMDNSNKLIIHDLELIKINKDVDKIEDNLSNYTNEFRTRFRKVENDILRNGREK